jgi:hypothetical protein
MLLAPAVFDGREPPTCQGGRLFSYPPREITEAASSTLFL